jgi:hypothetical protein
MNLTVRSYGPQVILNALGGAFDVMSKLFRDVSCMSLPRSTSGPSTRSLTLLIRRCEGKRHDFRYILPEADNLTKNSGDTRSTLELRQVKEQGSEMPRLALVLAWVSLTTRKRTGGS